MSGLKQAEKIFEEAGVSGLSPAQWCKFIHDLCVSSKSHPVIERYLKNLGDKEAETIPVAEFFQDLQEKNDGKCLKQTEKIFEEAGVSGLSSAQWCKFIHELCASSEIHPVIERYLNNLGDKEAETIPVAELLQDLQEKNGGTCFLRMMGVLQPTSDDVEDTPTLASHTRPAATCTSLLPESDVSGGAGRGSTEPMLQAPLEFNDAAVSPWVSSPGTSSELSRALIDLQHECASARIRHEEFFKQVLLSHKELQQELSLMRSTAESQATAQLGLKSCQEDLRQDLLAEFRGISKLVTDATNDKDNMSQTAVAGNVTFNSEAKSLVTGATNDKDIMSQTALAGNVTFNSESLAHIAADGTGKFCGQSGKSAYLQVSSQNNSEFMSFSSNDKDSMSQNAAAGNVIFNSESLAHIAADGTGKFCGQLGKSAHFQVASECASVSSDLVPSVSSCDVGTRKSKLAFEHFESECPGDQGVLTRLSRILRHKEFEFAIALALLCNCLVMCWEAQYQGLDVGYKLQYPGRLNQADVAWTGAEMVFAIFDWAFGMLFLFECLAKLACWQQAYFCDYWNILDFLCVIAFLFGKVARAGFKPHMLRLLRLFRLARLVRLIRYLESLEALYVMTTAIAGMKRILGWAIFLLTIMLLTCDLFVVQLLQATYFSEASTSNLTEDQLEKHQKMYAYFGTCTRCMLSMFEITLGNWPPIARLLSEEVSEWFTVLCLIHKLTIGFAVVGVINGVILQETFKVAQTDDIIMLRQKRRASDVLHVKLRNLFDSLDTNEDDKVVLSEFQRICTDTNIKTWLASLDIETDDVPTLFHLVDVDHDGAISIEELLSRMPRIRSAARSIDVLSLHEKLNKIIS